MNLSYRENSHQEDGQQSVLLKLLCLYVYTGDRMPSFMMGHLIEQIHNLVLSIIIFIGEIMHGLSLVTVVMKAVAPNFRQKQMILLFEIDAKHSAGVLELWKLVLCPQLNTIASDKLGSIVGQSAIDCSSVLIWHQYIANKVSFNRDTHKQACVLIG